MVNEKPKAIIRLVIIAPIVPYCRISFLPYFLRRKELITAVATCSKLIIDGRTDLNDYKFPLAISPA